MMLLGHGWGKLTSFAERSSSFPDPLGIGSSLSMALATGAEAFCALAVILGFATRWAAVPLMVTMLVAALIIHGDDPWAKKEFALLYFSPFATLFLTGAGRYSSRRLLPARRTLSPTECRVPADRCRHR